MKIMRVWWPFLSVLAAIAVERLLRNAPGQPTTKYPFYLFVLLGAGALFGIAPLIGRFNRHLGGFLREKAAFYSVIILAVNVLNILTKKFGVLPAIFFPAPDRVIGVLATDWRFLLLDCLASSAKLLFLGFLLGAFAGLVTGIAIGFSRRAAYWITPVMRILGPIPSTAWIPIVLVALPSTFSGGVFLIALSVWFPTTVMTSSGIANVQNAFFEVASTLGATRRYQIFHVGIPAAMPHIFIGLFTGACSSFITLMTAEMIGVKSGIGWYVNWQREMLSYANVYAGLILIAVGFFILITLFFKVRDHLLVWQKGVIKW